MKAARAYLWFCLAASVVFGGAYLIAPETVFRQMGIREETPAGLTDLRATYAGFVRLIIYSTAIVVIALILMAIFLL